MSKQGLKQNNSHEIEIRIVPLLKELLKRSWIMLLVGVVFAAGFYGFSKLTIKPTYRSGFTAYVNNQQKEVNKDYLTNSDLTASKELVKTYAEILKSRSILTKAAENLGLDYSYEKLRGMVTTEIQNETEIITVYAVHKDPQKAYSMAREIANIAPGYMADIIEGSSMKVIDYPVYSNNRFKPSYSRYAILGFLVGFLIVAIIVIIRYLMNDTISSESEVEERFGLPVLGVIPDLASSGKDTGYYYYSDEYGKTENRERSVGKHEKEK